MGRVLDEDLVRDRIDDRLEECLLPLDLPLRGLARRHVDVRHDQDPGAVAQRDRALVTDDPARLAAAGIEDLFAFESAAFGEQRVILLDEALATAGRQELRIGPVEHRFARQADGPDGRIVHEDHARALVLRQHGHGQRADHGLEHVAGFLAREFGLATRRGVVGHEHEAAGTAVGIGHGRERRTHVHDAAVAPDERQFALLELSGLDAACELREHLEGIAARSRRRARRAHRRPRDR
jgi:hypothetical protein